MNDREGFLSRWARRKGEAAKGEKGSQDRTDDPATQLAEAGAAEGQKETREEEADASGSVPEELSLDLSKLPSIESITAETDIRPFLARGVPSALRQAALRKMWVADPKIRDFIEIAENQWDFNAPGELLGFDFSPPTGDLKRMVADILGDKPDQEPDAKETMAEDAATAPVVPVSGRDSNAASQQNVASDQTSAASDQTSVVTEQAIVDAASQNNSVTQQEKKAHSKRRSHGGAVPSEPFA